MGPRAPKARFCREKLGRGGKFWFERWYLGCYGSTQIHATAGLPWLHRGHRRHPRLWHGLACLREIPAALVLFRCCGPVVAYGRASSGRRGTSGRHPEARDCARETSQDHRASDSSSVCHSRPLRYFGPFESIAWRQGCLWAWILTGTDFRQNATASYSDVLSHKSLFLIHGKADTVIPFSESVAIWEALGSRHELWLIDDATHVATVSAREHGARSQEFLDGRPKKSQTNFSLNDVRCGR